MKCLFCDNNYDSSAIEHIVPESFGNNDYTLSNSEVCNICNNRFSKFEENAMNSSVFMMERARLGIITKKGRNPKGKIKNLIIEGDKYHRKDYFSIRGLTNSDIKNYNGIDDSLKIIIPSFDKSEVSTSKLLLSMGFEALYKSQKHIYIKYNFQNLKDYLTTKVNIDWPFIISKHKANSFLSIPTYSDKYYLKRKHCLLKYCEISNQSLLFKFKFGGVSMIINLLNREIHWMEDYNNKIRNVNIYPDHYRVKKKNDR